MDVRAEIHDYINRKEKTGALLVTGKWGCGKSYLVKEIAKELNDSKKAAVAVISLFGLDSVAEINKRVKDEFTGFYLRFIGKRIRKLSKGFTTVVKDGLNVASVATAGTPGLSAASHGLSSIMNYDLFGLIDIKNTIGKGEKEREFIIAFDDLERSTLDKKVLLGAINEFVENKSIKVIIIADEEKIEKSDYKEYKEKLISRTIRLSDNYDAIIECIVNEYAETAAGYKQFLQANLHLIKQVFLESESHNLRTLKTVLADFERMYDAWKESDIATDNMKWALYTFAAQTFSSKAKPENKPAEEASFATENKEKRYSYSGKNLSYFSSFHSWIQNGEWNKEFFIRELKNKYEQGEPSPAQRIVSYTILSLQQEDIDIGLPEALKQAYNGELSRSNLITLLTNIHYLRVYSINLPCEVNYKQIKDGLNLRIKRIKQGDVFEPVCFTLIDEKQIDEEAFPIKNLIERIENQMTAWKYRNLFLDCLQGNDALSSYQLHGLPIDEFDDELLEAFEKKYYVSNNNDKRNWADTFLRIRFLSENYSSEDNRHKTKANFLKLVDWLRSMESNDSITGLINSSFIDGLLKSEVLVDEQSLISASQ